MGSFYSIASLFAGPGIGRTASHGALGLWRAGLLDTLVTLGHNPTEIAEERIVDIWFPRRRVFWFWPEKRYYLAKNRRFDKVCLRYISGSSQVVHLWNSQATQSARLARKLGKRLIIDRASTHISAQSDALVEAYKRHGIAYQPTYPETIERCLEEYELADVVLTPSPHSYQTFADQGFDLRKVVRCPFGVDLENFAPREEAPKRFRALFVGQLGVRKGIFTLLEAWRRANLDGELLLVGGEEEAVRAQLAPWKKQANIRFLGFRDDVPELMRNCSVFVFPSLEEGSALVTYEAMAAGLPLIVTGEAGSLARDGMEARFVKAHDVDGLAAALTEMAENPDLSWRMGRKARRRVEQYPWSEYGERVATVHRLLAQGRNAEIIQPALGDI